MMKRPRQTLRSFLWKGRVRLWPDHPATCSHPHERWLKTMGQRDVLWPCCRNSGMSDKRDRRSPSEMIEDELPERHDVLFDGSDGFQIGSILFSRRIPQTPVVPIGAGQMRTMNVAAHRYHDIHGRQFRHELASLCCFHVDAIELFHQSYGLLVDLRHGLCSGRAAFKHIGGQMLSKCLGNLASTGVVDTDECHSWLFIPMPDLRMVFRPLSHDAYLL